MNKSYQLILLNGPTVADPNSQLIAPMGCGGSAALLVDATMLRNGQTAYHEELQYHEADPTPREDRTGTGTFSVFGRSMRFDLSKSFPMLTTKKVWWHGIVAELLWMISGSTNIKPLVDAGVHIWDKWADENGELGPVYGAQWRSIDTGKDSGYQGSGNVHVDQLAQLLKNLKEKPNDRGHVISAWNPVDLPKMRLRPCHCLFQFYVENGKLSCQLYQRSADIFLGVPFNIASYALLTHMVAREVGLEVGEFIHTFGDLHLYANHIEQAKEQLTRMPRPFPQLEFYSSADIFGYGPKNFGLVDYNPHPKIDGEVSV
jgi:thymidylate synthase